jgi:hypothetical protein
MILEPGDRLLVAHRRLFPQDQPRFFLGIVEQYDHGIAVVSGFTFVRETLNGVVKRKDDLRTKILPILSGTLFIYRLPQTLDIQAVHIESAEGKLCFTDGHGFSMNLAEHAYVS